MSEVKKDELQIILEEQNVPAENAKALLAAFGAPFVEAGEILKDYRFDEEGELIKTKDTIEVTDEDDTESMAKAKEYRLILKKIRTGVENKRVELKEDSLKVGRAIDSVAKYVKDTIQPAEKYLELQEKYLETKLAEKAAKVKADRIEQLSKYTDDLSVYNFDTMREEAFDNLLASLKNAHEEKIKADKAEADRIEAERQAEIKKQEEIAEENKRLRAEAEKKEIADQIIRTRINRTTALGLTWEDEKQAYISGEFVITAQEIKELNDTQFDNLISNVSKKVQALQEEQRKADEAKRAEEDAKLEEERKQAEADRLEREKLQKAEDDRIALEKKQKEEADEAERAALLAPDKVKISSFSNALGIIRGEKLPAVKTKQAQDIVNFIDTELESLQVKIAEKVKSL